jgi:hypothetical protein
MKKLLISNGATMFRKFVLDHKRKHDMIGIHKKNIKRKDENGEIYWSKVYFYKKVERTEEEKQLKIEMGANPNNTNVKFKDVFVGDTPPEGYLDDELTLLKEQFEERIKFKGKDLVCDTDMYEKILAIAPDYFENLESYILN